MSANEKLSAKAIVGLLNSRKAVMCLIILSIATTALFLRFLDSSSFAAIISVIGTIFMYTHSRAEVASMGVSGYIPPPPASPITGVGDGVISEISSAIKK